MTKVYTDDNFMYHNCPDADIASWQNQLIDDYDRDYAPGQRICIDDATPEQWDAIDRATEKYRAESDSVDWSIAPSWANYWAMDDDGEAFWYENRPTCDHKDCVWNDFSDWSNDPAEDGTRIEDAPRFRKNPNLWKESLVTRPEKALDEMVKDAEELDLYEEKARDKMIGGDHYRQGGIQPIEYIHANNLSFCEGNVIKYISRWRYKDGLKDLEKAKHYIELLMELEDDY